MHPSVSKFKTSNRTRQRVRTSNPFEVKQWRKDIGRMFAVVRENVTKKSDSLSIKEVVSCEDSSFLGSLYRFRAT